MLLQKMFTEVVLHLLYVVLHVLYVVLHLLYVIHNLLSVVVDVSDPCMHVVQCDRGLACLFSPQQVQYSESQHFRPCARSGLTAAEGGPDCTAAGGAE